MSKKSKKEKRTVSKFLDRPLTPEEEDEAYELYLERISAPITNYRIWTDEEVEEARRQGLID